MIQYDAIIAICNFMIETIEMWRKDNVLTFGSKRKKVNEKYKYLLKQSISDINDILDKI